MIVSSSDLTSARRSLRRASGARTSLSPAGRALVTARLRLRACSLEAARASLESTDGVEAVLGLRVPSTWPPSDLRDALSLYERQLTRDPAVLGWGVWLAIERNERALVGSVGFKGKPDPRGCVEIGYGIEPEFRRRGYAAEAVPALVAWAWRQGVRRIVAECRPDNVASVRVLERIGMSRSGDRLGMLWWELCRPT